MDIVEKENKKNSKKKEASLSTGEVFRVVISKEANEALESALGRCTDGFDTGAITKSEVANYVFQNLNRFFQDSDVKALRAANFDDKKVLSSILKTDDDLPDELKKAIRAHYGIADKEKKRAIRSAQDLSTDSAVDNLKSAS
ncbi:MAG: hypothetical protein AB7H97_15105 [Pseudobdellovibrionaceae bacterium]